VRDELSDAGPEPAGWSTANPILVWSPVAGASNYDLDVFTMTNGVCDIQQAAQDFHVVTPLTAWTPLGKNPGPVPYPTTGTSLEKASSGLIAGDHYCVRIRAEGESSSTGSAIFGDYTFLNDAFMYDPGAPASGSVALPQNSDYISPVSGVVTGQTPLFTWHPIAGANSYWVIVSRDPSFTTLVDYGFTQIPAYAPRRTLADETTSLYWAVLPAGNADGTGLPIDPQTNQPVDPLHASAANFQKRSTPPTLLSPQNGTVLAALQPTFRWAPVQGALNYRLQVSTDPNFGTLLDNIVTGSTGYVSTTTYPAQSTLYWRVQAIDGDKTALTWSNPAPALPGTFKQVLPTPQAVAQTPAWQWTPVNGAVGYDVRVVYPGGAVHTYSKVPTPAMVPTQLSGTGVFAWQVRADFSSGAVGPYSSTNTFQRTVTPPAQTKATISKRALLLSWQGRPGLDEYVVQLSSTPDFSHVVETDKTQETVVASNLKAFTKAGGRVYWRVAAVDADGNPSGYSATKRFKMHRVKVG
jgi:hypothetical protein